MATADARWPPLKGTAWRVYFPLLDADGDLVTGGGADTPDAEVSIDGGAFADCTNEITEIATDSGMYYLELTAEEMDGDCICIICKTATAGTKTTPIIVYPVSDGFDELAVDIAAVKAETALIVEDTGTTLPATLATAQADLDVITGTAGVELGTGQTADWASQLEASAGQIIEATVDTVVNTHTPTTTEFQADDVTEATADHYNGRIVIFTSGALTGQATDITDYVLVGGIGQFTVTALTESPANNDTFVIV